MRVYGELERIAWLPRLPGFLINNGMGHTLLPTFFLSLIGSEFAHDGASRFSRHYVEFVR